MLHDPLAVNRKLMAVESSLRRNGAGSAYEVQDPGQGLLRESFIEDMAEKIRRLESDVTMLRTSNKRLQDRELRLVAMLLVSAIMVVI